MEQYIVKTGENIFDIAVTLSGTIEGIWDLLVCNDWLSMDTVLEKGMVINYHSEFVVNSNVTKWLKNNNISVKNGHHYDNDMNISDFIYKSMVDRVDALVSQELTDVQITDVTTETESGDTNDTTEAISEITESSQQVTSITSSDTASQTVNKAAVKKDVSQIDAAKINITSDIISSRIPSESFAVSDETKYQIAQSLFNITEVSQAETTENVAEKNAQFWEDMCQPKIIIDQYGTFSSIKTVMGSSGFIAVDWGDNTNFDAYWGDGKTTYIEHDFEDTGRHIIRIYGIMDIQDLDLSELNGIYYMISPVYVSGNFVGNSATNEIANGLLLTKETNTANE